MFSLQTLEVSVKRCIAEGLTEVEDSNRIKDAEKDVKILRKARDQLIETRNRKKEKLGEILAFHKLVEEVNIAVICILLVVTSV